MLMNHKIFHFTQIPDKTNDVIFLKSLTEGRMEGRTERWIDPIL